MKELKGIQAVNDFFRYRSYPGLILSSVVVVSVYFMNLRMITGKDLDYLNIQVGFFSDPKDMEEDEHHYFMECAKALQVSAFRPR